MRALDPATPRAVRDAWMAHLVLVFPAHPIGDHQQIAFARRFGELEVRHHEITRSRRPPEIFRLANVDGDGMPIAPGRCSPGRLKSTRAITAAVANRKAAVAV